MLRGEGRTRRGCFAPSCTHSLACEYEFFLPFEFWRVWLTPLKRVKKQRCCSNRRLHSWHSTLNCVRLVNVTVK